MPEVAICPDCQRPAARHYWDDEDEFCFATGSIATCVPKTITRLRQELATLTGKYDLLVAAHALATAPGEELSPLEAAERAVVEAAVGAHEWGMKVEEAMDGNKFRYAATRRCEVEANNALWHAIGALLAERAKARG